MIGIHKEYLMTEEFTVAELPTYSSELQKLIAQGTRTPAKSPVEVVSTMQPVP
jgi:hypothetical protein